MLSKRKVCTDYVQLEKQSFCGVDELTRRAIYECVACCDKHCTVRTYGGVPPKCLYWHDKECWVRKDKHEQKELGEYEDLAGLGYGFGGL